MTSLVRFGGFEVDLAAGRLFKHGLRIHLREQSFQVLALLLERPGEVVTREDLRGRLWPAEVFVDFENNLNAAVARLREALGDSAERPRFIETLPKRGYRFVGTVEGPAAATGKASTPRPKARLLVLPFVNASGDPGQEYFGDAMTDEIITELASLAPAELAVLARTTSMHYKGAAKDVAQIGRELALDYLVEGSARRADNHVALTVQLIRAADQAHVFARRYESAMSDLFATEHAIALEVAEHLHVVPAALAAAGSAEVGRPRRPPTQDLAAYTSYAQGRWRMHRSPGDAAAAKQLFEEAIRRDPQFALAHDALADLYWFLGFAGLMAPRDVWSKGLLHALRAVEIDGTLAETHAMVAQYRLRLEFDWPEVEREMRLALELNPNSPIVRLRYGTSGLMPHGRLDEAIAEVERALELDPLSSWTRGWLVTLLWLGRHAERAIDEARKAVEFDPTFGMTRMQLGVALCQAGRFDEAVAELRKTLELIPVPAAQGWLGFALAFGGHEAEARQLLGRFHAMAAQAYVPPTNFAWIHLGLGEIDEAFAWMDKAIDARDGMMTPIKSYWFLDPVRDDPRFAALLRKMNLA
jgi:TolB-like protein/Tfp pilus assembly protein PilF